MGIGDLVNSGLDKAGDVVDAGKKLVGEGVDKGTDLIGEGLDQVGAHRYAVVVENAGDKIASKLGATPGEKQLGDTDLASDLVHGDPKAIRAAAKHLADFSTAFDKVGDGMRKLNSRSWQGEAANAFREKFAVHPTKWLQAADACDEAGRALSSYADTVEWAQGRAQDAIDLYGPGKRASDAHKAEVKKDASTAEGKKKPEPSTDPGAAAMTRAHEILTEARRQRDEAARTASGAVRKALAHAPAEPPPLDQLKADAVDGVLAANTEILHFGGGVVKGTAGILTFARGLNPTDPYNITHPAAYFQNVNMTLAGLISTAAHPERAAKTMLDDFMKDPAEGTGRLLPNLFGDGAGLEAAFGRAALKEGMESAVESGVQRSARDAAGDAAGAGRKGATENPEGVSRRPEETVCERDPIDVATGRMVLPQTDLSLPGSLPLVLKRSFNSAYRSGRWFGPTWSSTVDQRLEIDAEGVVLIAEDGLLLTYPHPAPGLPTLPDHGPRWPLNRVDGGYTITDPDSGRVRHFADSGADLAVLEQLDDRNGNWITFEYDAEGAPLGLAHSGGYELRFTTAHGRITALHLTTDAASESRTQEILRYGYTDGHLTEVTNSSGIPLHFACDEHGRITSWTDTNGSRFDYVYDDRDRCTHQSGVAGHLNSTFAYDTTDPETGDRVTAITNSPGHTARYLINDRAQVTAEIDETGSVTRYRRDRHNRLLSRTDPLGHTTAFRYDETGNLLTVTRPDGRESRAEYSELGLPVRLVNPDGTVVRQTYDERGNRTSVTGPTGHTTHFAYDDAGHLTRVTDPLGQATTVHCDRTGLPLEITDPFGGVTRYERDSFGRPLTVTDALGATTRLEWSVEGHLSHRTAPDGTTESWTYDGEGNCTTHTDPLGGVSHFEYTHFDLLTSRTGPDGVRYEFTHDKELNLTQVTNPQGLSWSYAYNAAGRLIGESDFDDCTLTYTHDATGHLISRTNALGETTEFERNELGQVTRKNAAGQVTTYAYDMTDGLAQATGPDTTLTILRDRHGRVRSETVDGRELTYRYDEFGRRTGRTTPTGGTTTWTYDEAGRRTGITASGRSIDFTYDEMGRELARQVGELLTLEHTFDVAGRLTTQSVVGRTGTSLQHRAYTYRADGNLTAIDDRLSGSRRFDLDAAGRVTAVHAANWTETYAYDEAGNQIQATWPTGHPGQEATGARSYTGTRITRAGNVRYEHDELGRTTLRQKTRLSRKPDTWRYEWDTEDRLTQVTTPDGTRWRYTYDPLGRRTAKLRLAAGAETVVEKVVFTWDGTTLCEQTTTSVDLPNPVILTWDHQGLSPIAQTERITTADTPQQEIDSRFFAIVTDLVGTPTELIDEQGDIAWRTRSTLWGTTAWAANSTAYTPLRFPGQYFDPETGLHYNYFRHYDPETARYLTSDPLGLAPAPNPVGYVHNPQTWADPWGLAPCKDAEQNAAARNETVLGKEVPVRDEASVGSTSDHNYRKTFFSAHPDLEGKVVVHHAIEQQVLKRYPNLFTPDEIHSLENLRGIPKGDINSRIHLSEVRVSWNRFYETHPNPTRQEVLDQVTRVDDTLGHWFSPRIR
ncbi:putative T7SS-secreted protein [Streptomyces sp. NPDC050538]|uniref:putative T7SS-secreted protein n=1 Tax=Streptomyces sp. NPDC050538 TaxID=3365627 RepID=UPI0037A9A125